MIDRRKFLATASLAAASASSSRWAIAQSPKPLSILILGGTRFIGVEMTELALKRGHKVTFFNRGKTNADLFPDIERIKGDRNGEIAGLKGRKWDAVIDNSGYFPRAVTLTAELLASSVSQYLFVSSISVYPDFTAPRDETSPVGKLKDESIEKVDNDTYGPLKAPRDGSSVPRQGPLRANRRLRKRVSHSKLHHHMSRHRVVLQRIRRKILPVTTPLEPTVRHLTHEHEVRVDPCAAVLQPSSDLHRPPHILRPHG
jgi:hypothetical protein